MAPVNSQQFLQQLKNQVTTARALATSHFGGQPDMALLQPPQPNSWSAIQCLEHLNSYGRFYLPALGKAIEQAVIKGTRADPAFRSGLVGGWFTRLMLPDSSGNPKSKMQAPKDHQPIIQLSADKVLKEFVEQQVEMESLLVAATRINLEKVKVPTSLSSFIRMSAGDTFAFLIAHMQRHLRQAERAIAAAKHS
ncbi:DinB family protein [Chitinophaga sp. sic0106]|uniref:DinB family protein n=1 Tax=Chitinophaga sp. sic0106 TaxID=2854785 RepID=UPI001C44E367|nr:DinB family protein [Chitinophaga sp. sic0106]MBV7533641.1 DinB family protein [Chitinophaga sp. sic0106]